MPQKNSTLTNHNHDKNNNENKKIFKDLPPSPLPTSLFFSFFPTLRISLVCRETVGAGVKKPPNKHPLKKVFWLVGFFPPRHRVHCSGINVSLPSMTPKGLQAVLVALEPLPNILVVRILLPSVGQLSVLRC